jgi:hypothetical protein
LLENCNTSRIVDSAFPFIAIILDLSFFAIAFLQRLSINILRSIIEKQAEDPLPSGGGMNAVPTAIERDAK